MDAFLKILGYPFTKGLVVGLIFAAWALWSGWSARRALRREARRETQRLEGEIAKLQGEIRELKEHWNTATELARKGNQALMDENAELKKQNENLRISLAELKNKPDRAEIQKLYLLDKAVHLMYSRAPGFAPAWESILQEAQAELDKTSSGLIPWIRRIIHPSAGASPVALPLPEMIGGKTEA